MVPTARCECKDGSASFRARFGLLAPLGREVLACGDGGLFLSRDIAASLGYADCESALAGYPGVTTIRAGSRQSVATAKMRALG